MINVKYGSVELNGDMATLTAEFGVLSAAMFKAFSRNMPEETVKERLTAALERAFMPREELSAIGAEALSEMLAAAAHDQGVSEKLEKLRDTIDRVLHSKGGADDE